MPWALQWVRPASSHRVRNPSPRRLSRRLYGASPARGDQPMGCPNSTRNTTAVLFRLRERLAAIKMPPLCVTNVPRGLVAFEQGGDVHWLALRANKFDDFVCRRLVGAVDGDVAKFEL